MAPHYTRKKAFTLITIALFLNAFGGIANHYSLGDGSFNFWIGAIHGMGISLMVFGLAKGNFRKKATKS